MVICKYFQQGNCRFGQYCKFDHTFGANRSKNNDDKNIALLVAQEILAAERGGQWLLSCYGPFKEKKCIPGMEDISPEEVRWEMYQAQKNNTVDQVNAQFQQMCEQMKAKHEALKNPTPQVFQLLESIQNSAENPSFGDKNKGNYAFGASQVGSSTQTNNVFGQKTYGASSNPFGTTNSYNNQQSSSSIFGRTPANSNSVFGSKPNFGSATVFGGTTSQGNSIFGGASKSASTPFGATQNTQTFGGLSSQGQNTSLFGGSTSNQSTFGQTATFSTSNNQTTNSFLKPQTSVFGNATSSGNAFGGTSAPGATIFGAAPTTAVSNASTGSVFGQPTAAGTAFGGAPVFGGSSGFGPNQRPGASVFGNQSVFGSGGTTATSPTPNNVFGGANAGTSSFGGIAQSSTTNVFGSANPSASANVFGSTSASVSSSFETPPNATPFGASISTASAPFGTAAQPGFATATSTSSVFGGSAAVPFSQGSSFSSSSNVFGNVADTITTATAQSPFGTNTFGGTQQQSNTTVFGVPICSPNVKSNPFVKSSPFGTASSSQSSPFGNFSNSGGAVGLSVSVTIDETGYSLENSLTDDEKAAYKMGQFPEGQIPLKPPTKELS